MLAAMSDSVVLLDRAASDARVVAIVLNHNRPDDTIASGHVWNRKTWQCRPSLTPERALAQAKDMTGATRQSSS